MTARPRLTRFRVHLRIIAHTQFDRVEAAGHREFVHRDLGRVGARAFAGRAHPERDRDIECRELVGGAAAGGAVHLARGDRGLFGELLDRRGLFDDVVHQRGDAAVVIGAQPDPLDGRRAVADEREHLLACQCEFHGPTVAALRREDRQYVVRVRCTLRAESAADMWCDHADLLGFQAEDRRQRLAHRVHALRRVVQHDSRFAAVPEVPLRDARMRLHRVVVLDRRLVGLVDGHRGLRERGLHIAVVGVGFFAAVDLVGRVQTRVIGAQFGVVWLLQILDADQSRCFPGGFGRLGEYAADDLTTEMHAVVLQDRELAVGGVGQLRGVEHREDAAHPVECTGRGDVHGHHAPAGDGGLHRMQIQRIVDDVLERVRRGAGDLGAALLADDGLADGAGFPESHCCLRAVSMRN